MVSVKDCSVATCGESTMFPLEGIAHITPHWDKTIDHHRLPKQIPIVIHGLYMSGLNNTLPHPLSLAIISGCVIQAITGVVDSVMVKENNYLIICAQHCDTYDIVAINEANCNIMLTNKVKNKNIMLHKWFRLIE